MAHRIAVGALLRGDRVLLAHRVPGRRAFPDRWDLPGGHVERGEGPAEALVRELREELGVDAEVTGPPSLRIEHRPELEDGAILDVWVVKAWRGEPMNAAEDEHDELRWVDLDALLRLDLAHEAYGAFFRDLLTAGA